MNQIEEYSKKIDGDGYSISIYGFYDKEWNSWRYSWSVQIVGCYMTSGGYMDDNSVAYPTKESALESAIGVIVGQDTQKKRDMIMEILLEIK